jgi:hypothetical protein
MSGGATGHGVPPFMFAKFKQGSKDLAMTYRAKNSSLPEVLLCPQPKLAPNNAKPLVTSHCFNYYLFLISLLFPLY